MFHGKTKMQKVLMWFVLLAYVACWVVLIVEAALPGSVSADQSNNIGGGIADIINNNAGDQSVLVNPASLAFEKPASTSLYVGDSLQLSWTILPEDCSYQSVTFQSSDENVLSVSDSGSVKAKSAGTAEVTCFSTNFPDKKDTLTFEVKNVLDTAIVSSLSSSLGEDGNYHLEANRSYRIQTSFTPSSTTDQSLTYSCTIDGMSESEVEEYAFVSEDLLYTRKALPALKVGTVTVQSATGNTSSFSFSIKENTVEVIDLKSITVTAKTTPQYQMAVKESISFTSKFNVTFTPSNATYKSYTLSSSDPTIIKVSGTKLTALKVGECDITVTPTQYSFSSSIRVKVVKVPLKNVKLSLDYRSEARIKAGESGTIRLSSPSPSNADSILQKFYTFESSDTAVLTVDKNGKVTAKSKGSATVSVSFYNSSAEMEKKENALVKTIGIEVFVPTEVSDITFLNNLDESNDHSHILYNGKTYNLSSLIKIDKMIGLDGKVIDSSRENISTTLTYSISSKSSTAGDLSDVKISGSTLSTTGNNIPGVLSIEYTHQSSGISETQEYTLINEVKPVIERDEDSRTLAAAPLLSDSLSLYVTSSGTVRFPENQSYHFTPEIGYEDFAKITETSSNSLTFRGIDEGSFQFGITPVYNEKELTGVSKSMKVSVHHKIATGFSLRLFLNDSENPMDLSSKTDEQGNLSLSVDVDSTLRYDALYEPFEFPTNCRMSVKSDNPKIGEYKEDTFLFHKVGKVTFEVKEEVSGVSKNITFHVINRVKLDEKSPVTLKQAKASYDKETDTYHIENGMAAKIITNFDPSSTFTKVKYQSSDTEILKVGNDGNITPLKAGNADIICSINDSNTIDFSYRIHLVVEPKSFISNMSTFLYKIRKGLGHFGAFLITAIFSVLFYFFAFEDKRNLIFSLPFCFLQGLFLAEFTEFIQLFTPGRSGLWSDVMIDYTGFAIGAGITLAVILLVYLVLFCVKKYKEKKKNTDQSGK